MLFNSVSFAIFLPIIFFFYWFITSKSRFSQNILLLISSYFFYACWDWRFLFLLIFSTLLDFYTGIKITTSPNKTVRRMWFFLSIIINLGFLVFFKYYNFFIGSFAELTKQVGLELNPWTLKIILPVGISFYTFHGLSYIVDVYKNRIKAERNFIDYSLFVSFFPLLVAGPIERATHLLPQLKVKRHFNYREAVDGLRQILWGLFKKILIADNCATIVNSIFDSHATLTGSSYLLGGLLFTFQIYGDFSGYSDIALGVAKLFGINLLRNFSYPYFSRNIAEFWRRWHISLSSWFKDYVYIPLGGSKVNTWKKIRNVFVIFILSGFWHGANWTFILWGAMNALYILPSVLLKSNRTFVDIVAKGKSLPTLKEFIAILITFTLTVFAWIVFRSPNVSTAVSYIFTIFSHSLFTVPLLPTTGLSLKLIMLFIGFLLVIEWRGRENEYAIAKLGSTWSRPKRWLFYYSLILAIMHWGGAEQQFIYFQF